MKFEAADCLAQRGVIDFDGEKINMHMLILTPLKIKSNYSLDWFNMQNRNFTFQKFHLQHIIDLHNKTNKVNFQAIDAVVNEKLKVVYFCKRKRFILFFLFVCLLLLLLFLPWHSRVEQFARTPDNLIEKFKSLRNAEVSITCCWSITKDRNWSAQAESIRAKVFAWMFSCSINANFTFSHPKYFEYALPVFLFVHSPIVTRIGGNVNMLHCLRWFFYLLSFFLSIF